MEQLKNYMEYLVEEQLEEFLKMHPENCKCENCRIDIKAYALNKLPPHYVVSDKGYIYNKIDEMRLQSRIDVLKVIIEGSEVISKYPRH